MVPPYSHRIPRVRWYSGYGLATPHFPYRTLTLFGWLSHAIRVCIVDRLCRPNPSSITTWGLAFSAFARHYSRNLGWFLFLSLLRCFSSGGSPRIPMYSVYVPWFFTMGVSPFGNPRIYCLFAAPRGLSQLVTSFFGSWCQGIRLVLLFAWTFLNELANSSFFVLWIAWVSSKHLGYYNLVKRFYPYYWSFISTFVKLY